VRLRFLGHACFDLQLAGRRLCLDPHRPGALEGRLGLPAPRGPFDLLIASHRHADHHGWSPELGPSRFLEDDLCEAGLEVAFHAVFHDREAGARRGLCQAISVRGEGLRLVHLGDIGSWDSSDLAWLAGTAVLLVPVGGTFTLDGAEAAELVRLVRPRLAVPMHAADPRVDLPLAPVSVFLAALGWPVEERPEITGADLAGEPRSVVLSPP
jgi:L-ascorbate metabolism protein UlaG (beta-lactamase superfamily)